MKECLNYAKEIDHLSSLVYAQSVYAMIHQYHREAQAASCFNQAITVSKEKGTKFSELQATISLTKLLMKQGRNTEARNIPGKIYNWFSEGFDTKVLKEARNLLEELT